MCKQAVDAAEVDERAEVGEVLDRAGADLADGDLGHQVLAEGDALGLDQPTAREHDVPAVLVDREDHAADLAVEVVGDVRRPADVDLAGGQEGVDADVDQQAALDLAGDLAGDDVPFAVLGDDALPGPHPVGLLAREDDLAGVVVHPFEQDLDLVAGLGGLLAVFPLVERDEPFGLVADVDDHLVANNLDDPAGDDAAGLDPPAIAEEFVHVEFFLGVHVGDVEFAEQVSIYHKRMSVRSVESDERRGGLGLTSEHEPPDRVRRGRGDGLRGWPALARSAQGEPSILPHRAGSPTARFAKNSTDSAIARVSRGVAQSL